MRKQFILFMTAVFVVLSLCACSGKTETGDGTGKSPDTQQSGGGSPDVRQATGSSISSGDGGLRYLSNRHEKIACNTEKGYYYLTQYPEKLRDGSYGMHLMYMDFATGREIYLCSTAGCKHDTPDCTSVFLQDDFPAYSTMMFVLGDKLYILAKEYDQDGSVSQDPVYIGGDGNDTGGGKVGGSVESQPAVLYSANMDGTERRNIYTFDAALTLEEKVAGNEQGIYVITKKLSADKDGGQTYTTSSERKLMYLDFGSLSLAEVCSMDFGDNISWKVMDCSQEDFLLCGTDFGRKLSRDETWDDDRYKELYQNSVQVYALLSRNGGKPKEIARQSNKNINSVLLLGDNLYLSSDANQKIEVLDIKTGKKKTFCKLPGNQIMEALGDTLCCRSWDLAGDPIWYFVNTKTGAVSKTPLVNLRNGWSLDFCAETSKDVLFVYDYDATESGDGSYEIHQYKHALISKEDLFAGKDNYRRIKMIGPGQ